MKEVTNLHTREKWIDDEKTLHRILTATQTGTIVCRIARTLNIPTYEAFRRFILTKSYANFRKPGSLLSMWGDPAIVDVFLAETQPPTANTGSIIPLDF